MATSVIIVIGVLVAVNVAVFVWIKLRDRKDKESPVQSNDPVEEPKQEQKFKAGDWIVSEEYGHLQRVLQVVDNFYVCESESFPFEMEDMFHLWTIEDAKPGDVLRIGNLTFILESITSENCQHVPAATAYCCYEDGDDSVGIDGPDCISDLSGIRPATTDEYNMLLGKLHDAGYEWDPDNLTLSKAAGGQAQQEEDPGKDKCEGCNNVKGCVTCVDGSEWAHIEDPSGEPEEGQQPEVPDMHAPDPRDISLEEVYKDVMDLFDPVLHVWGTGNTEQYLYERYLELVKRLPGLLKEENFPVVLNYYKDERYQYWAEKTLAWLFAMILSEIVPEKRSELYRAAYDCKEKGSDVPTFGHSFDTDPTNLRIVAASVWSVTRDADMIPVLRKELGARMLKFKKDISECFVDICQFLPKAPGPYLKGYDRPAGTVPGQSEEIGKNLQEDYDTHQFVSLYYSLSTKDMEKRQMTIQAISNKEHKKPHLFGGDRTVTDPKYGQMTFHPVFGKHNIGVEIPEDGAIANLCYTVGMASTNNRKSLLDQEYGRRRPGEGTTDGKACSVKRERVLVNFSIEDGDGHKTGYYDKDGDWVDDNGQHIGDYETYFQNQVYANSYPSGHSAYIMGAGMVLMAVMPDRSQQILEALNEFAVSRVVCRYHWPSDTMMGRTIGTMMMPVMCGTENCDIDGQLEDCRKEYEDIKSGVKPDPAPTDKVNVSLSYACGGYGSCHVDAGETAKEHYCNKECYKERHPFISVSQKVDFTIEGGGVTTVDGKTSGTWEANTNYELVCPAVAEGEERTARITMRNKDGVRVLNYRLSREGTHDDGAGK